MASANPDIELARTFGLPGYNAERDVAGCAPATKVDSSPAAASAAGTTPVAEPARQASAATAPRKMPPAAKATKSERFLQIRATREDFGALERQIGRPVATAVGGRRSYHQQQHPGGSETRLFAVLPGGIHGLDRLRGEIAPGVHASVAPADLSLFRPVGASASKPIQVDIDLVDALAKAIDR